MTNYVVSGPTLLFQGSQIGQLTLKNIGATNPVYLGHSTNVSADNGFLLSPGSSIVWDASQAIYAYAPSTAVSTVSILPNGGQLFDAQAVANSLIYANLPQLIAQNIAISGAPPIDAQAVLLDYGAGVPIASDTVVNSSTGQDVSAYQSINFYANTNAITNGLWELLIEWGIISGGLLIVTAQESFAWVDQGPTAPNAKIPATVANYVTSVKGKNVRLTIRPLRGGTANDFVRLRMIGSYKTINRPRYLNLTAQHYADFNAQYGANGGAYGYGSDGFAGLTLNSPASVAGSWLFSHVNGPATLSATVAGTGGTVNIVLNDQEFVGGQPISQLIQLQTAGTAATLQQVTLPSRPIACLIQANASATQVRVSVTAHQA